MGYLTKLILLLVMVLLSITLCAHWFSIDHVFTCWAAIDRTLHVATALLDSAALPSGLTSSACPDPGRVHSEEMGELNDMTARHMSIRERWALPPQGFTSGWRCYSSCSLGLHHIVTFLSFPQAWCLGLLWMRTGSVNECTSCLDVNYIVWAWNTI